MRLARLLATTAMATVIAGCSLLTPLPEPRSTTDRLAALPVDGAPVDGPVTIHWNEYQVPYIVAESDDDLAATLGIVHAHLRLGQMEMARRLVQGRLSEMGGPLATDIDHALRILNYGRGVEETLSLMPEDTRRWLDRFVAGVNFYIENAPEAPHEFRVLGIEPEPWTAADVITIGRLGSTDVNWLVWFGMLERRNEADWAETWSRATTLGSESVPSFGKGADTRQAYLFDLLSGAAKTGSNSVAVSGTRSATGAALMANDPHLGIFLPNLWLLAGYRSPSYHAVGMMIPGVPFLALGRNERIAWGGTNMRALSTDLVDVGDLPADAFVEREETIPVRWWFDKTVTIRETAYGPVITDAPMVEAGDGPPVALRWMGHRPSDEVTAMLRVNRAGSFAEFRSALDGFHVPGQNMLYADVDGHIGQVMAVKLPVRPTTPPEDLLASPAESDRRWQSFVTAQDLPAAYDPPTGFLASANNRPAEAEVAVGWHFSNDDRIVRLREILSRDGSVTPDELMSLQRDVYMPSAVALRDALLARVDAAAVATTADRREVFEALRDWDGHYAADSRGALAFELTMFHFGEVFLEPEQRRTLLIGQRFDEQFGGLIAESDASKIERDLAAALEAAAPDMTSFGVWGEMHRLGLRHPLSFIPVIGARYRFGDAPAAGSTTTVMKTAHDDTDERHVTRYGSQSRHISDMSDPDANWFTLLGGQDGWINSANFTDQFPLWLRGDYVRLPLRVETVEATFPHRTVIVPR